MWTGVVSFGLVSVPVALYSATKEHEVSFHQFQRGTSDRIRYQRVNVRTGEEVPYDDIVKGAEVGDGQYVIVESEGLSVVHVTVADDMVGLTDTDVIAGGLGVYCAV